MYVHICTYLWLTGKSVIYEFIKIPQLSPQSFIADMSMGRNGRKSSIVL